ncbi:MocR-like pyridoxine biosynthesis transcription factor PdxR [Hyphomicrobium sp. 2TAF46]|uniref:MocR-like pyridoxine biosynthesis transcription factor PdxR n=1 Tax=Hyphomicrobium sp. 2TAF46 TaxID=3233019 RepID=UPI003F92A035
MELPLHLEPDLDRTLQVQIFEQIRQMILDGLLKPGMALPPSRLLSERFSISRNTATLAYDRLASEGYVESRGTAGTFVSSTLPDDMLSVPSDSARSNGPLPGSADPLLCFAGSPGGGNDRPRYDFWVGRSDPHSFPLRIWRRLINRRLIGGSSRFLTDYCDPAGLPELREAIAAHLGRSRGMAVTHDQIIVTTGGQDALNLICGLVQPDISQLCIENPCYLGASMLFKSTGKPIVPIPVDSEGVKVEQLPTSPRNLLYVTPSHQFPTGVTMPLGRRLALLRWAEETDSYIVEDDYDSDFRYDGPPITSLSGLGRCRRVFYMGTFSKSIGAGLRIGYAVVPRLYWDDARLLKAQMSNGHSWLEQAVLTDFLTEGHFERHLRKLRQLYKARRDCLERELRSRFRDTNISGAECGLHFIWRLAPHFPPAQKIQLAARAAGVGVYALRSGAAFDFRDDSKDDVLVFGFSSLDEASILNAVGILKTTLQNLGA